MKKIISVLSLCFLFAMSNDSKAQVQSMTSSTYTVVNTGTINLDLKVNDLQKQVSIQYIGTKVSGTVGGTATLQGSIDGTNFKDIPTAMIRQGANAFTNTDVATQSYIWSVADSPFLWYRVACVGTGTMSLIVAGKVLPRK